MKQSPRAGVYLDMRLVHAMLAIGILVLSGACGPVVDLTSGLRVEGVSTGWYEAAAANAQIKLVPAVSFTLKNLSNQKLGTLQVNAVFRRIDQDQEWASGFLTAAGSDGLPPGGATRTLFVPSPLGYTGTESRLDMLWNSHFVDAYFANTCTFASTKWVPVGEFPIARHLIDP